MKYGFDDFTLDVSRGELSRGGARIPITPKTFAVLKLLIERREEIVSREDLLEAVWKKRFISDSTFHSQMNAVRSAVGDSGRTQRVIRTVARKGFRFIAALTDSAPIDAVLSPSDLTAVSAAPRFSRSTKIAVIPFRNHSAIPELNFFAAAFTEDLLGCLTRIDGLIVQTRFTQDVTIAPSAELHRVVGNVGIDFVMEGSVRQTRDVMRVSVQLVDSVSGACVWANRFDGDPADPFGFQDRILTNVTTVLTAFFDRRALEHMRLTRTVPRTSCDFYDLAMIHVRRGSKDSMRRAFPLLLNAMDLDSENAKAKAAASWCSVWLKLLRGADEAPLETSVVVDLAKRAVEMEWGDPQVLIHAGYALGHFEGDLGFTLGLFDRALALDPANPVAWSLSGAQLISGGNTVAGLERVGRAVSMGASGQELGNAAILSSLGNIIVGDLVTARTVARTAISMLPQAPQSAAVLAASHALAGDMEEASAAMRILRSISPDLRVSGISQWVNLQREDDLRLFEHGLIEAGLPR